MTRKKEKPRSRALRAGNSGGHGKREGGSGAHRHQSPAEEGEELLYGIHTVREALDNSARRILRAFATRNALAKLQEDFRTAGIAPEIVEPKELSRRLGADAVHQGVLLLAEPLPEPTLTEVAADSDLLLLLDQITDPHNIGAILRSAAAFCVGGVITTRRHAPAAFSGVLAKAASGALEHVPFVRVTNLARAMTELREKYGFALWGLDSDGEGRLDCAMRVPGRIALVLGAEGKGLRLKVRERCDAIVRLDMPGPIRSLNVSNAAAIALFALHQGRLRHEAGEEEAG